MKTKGFLHITIAVTDLERSTTFYRDVLGCELVRRNPIMSFMKTGEDFFVLTKMEGFVPTNPVGKPELDTTLFHHALLLEPDEFDAALAQLREQGVEYYDCTGHNHNTFPGRRHVYIYDPDYNSIELTTMIPSEMKREPVAAR